MATRHVTNAAKELRLSQPALSHQLNRLREVFKDELFVKTPSGMVPTALALELAPSIQKVFEELENNVFSTRRFDPKTLKRTFRIRTTDFLEHLLADKLARALEREAPQAQLSFTALQFALPRQELESSAIDLAIAGYFEDIPSGFYHQLLFKEFFRCCVARKHPRIRRQPSLEDYLFERHILIAPGGTLESTLDASLKKNRASRFVSVGTSSYLSSGWLVSQTDAILTAPSRLIESFEKFLEVKGYELPVKRDPVHIIQVWHERQNSDVVHKWFRQLVFESLRAP